MIKLMRYIYAKWKFRKIPYGVCCCGANMEDHPVWDNHSPRDEKEYTITSYVEGRRI